MRPILTPTNWIGMINLQKIPQNKAAMLNKVPMLNKVVVAAKIRVQRSEREKRNILPIITAAPVVGWTVKHTFYC